MQEIVRLLIQILGVSKSATEDSTKKPIHHKLEAEFRRILCSTLKRKIILHPDSLC